MGSHRMRTTMMTGVVVAVMLCTALATSFAFANPGGDNVSTAIQQALPLSVTGSLDSTTTDERDVYAITLAKGQTLEASMTVTSPAPDTNFDIMLYKGSTTPSIDETNTLPSMWGNGPLYEHFTFMAATGGTYYLDVHAWKGAGNYALDAKIVDAVKFKIGSLSLPKSAKKGKKVKVAAVVTPAYNGANSPVFFYFYRYEGGKYRRKTMRVGNGIRNPGEANSKLSVTYKFPKKGKWRVRAEFWDQAHNSKFTGYKYIKIK
jgi:hypothetical protein